MESELLTRYFAKTWRSRVWSRLVCLPSSFRFTREHLQPCLANACLIRQLYEFQRVLFPNDLRSQVYLRKRQCEVSILCLKIRGCFVDLLVLSKRLKRCASICRDGNLNGEQSGVRILRCLTTFRETFRKNYFSGRSTLAVTSLKRVSHIIRAHSGTS